MTKDRQADRAVSRVVTNDLDWRLFNTMFHCGVIGNRDLSHFPSFFVSGRLNKTESDPRLLFTIPKVKTG